MDNWEVKLTNLAFEAMENAECLQNVKIDKRILEQAYRYCDSITKKHSKTFHLASGLLPAEKSKSARALYAFCRISDDIIDFPETNLIEKLELWRQRALSTSIIEDDPIIIAWLDTRIKYNIPAKYAEHLIDGVSRDLYRARYNTFDELAEYCYGVASTVGLMTMHIIGFRGLKAIPYAIKMGVSLQLNNILRDVGEDWKAGRLYLPLDELRDFGLSESDIQVGIVDDRWRAFMKFQIDRCRQLYAESLPGIALLDPDGRFAIASAAELYRAILDDIEANDYDVFNRRAYVSFWGKLSRLPGIWWRSKTLSY
ncbi:MAG: phytoene/squalene synthase family protein [Candidatus Poribacteria bacterium]